MIPRFFSPHALTPGARVELSPDAAHHAVRVLRMRTNDPLILFDGQGGEWSAELKVGAGGTAQALLREFSPRECESPLAVTLIQALPAGDKMDWIVEKCVELGVAAIQPVVARRSVVRLSAERMARRIAHWNAIARAACEQCGRNRVPPVLPLVELSHYLAGAAAPDRARLILAPQGAALSRRHPCPASAVDLLVGPEGGWEETELQAASSVGFNAVRLGPRILRTETAGSAALAALQTLWGDFLGE